ncbi:ATP-binding protein [Streptomyces sclerotialus]|uniref:ATP-binding protein n=1 Tax=Streptomyces sclerotialus TaxID=1957 RepID=UPI0018C8DFBC
MPATLLLGPRGSGKTTLLEYLTQWARQAPVAHLDLETLSRRSGKPLDVLTNLVFQLNVRKPHCPKLSFPAFGALLIAVTTTVDPDSRDRAVREMRQALVGAERPDGSPQPLRDELKQLLEAGATALGAPPGWTLAAVRLLPEWQRLRIRLRTHRQLAWARRAVGLSSTEDFLVGLSQLYNDEEAYARQRAESVFFDAFVADLCDAYAGPRADRLRTTHCLVLLDNVDSPLGDSFLDSLLKAREKSGSADPLLVLATAGSRPELLTRREPGAPPVSRYLECWSGPRQFRPVHVEGLHVGLLRDLHRHEVTRMADTILADIGPESAMPRADDAVQWLGWLVHELTAGHPAASDRVFKALRDFERNTPWDERLRQVFAPPRTLAGDILDTLLPRDVGWPLRRALTWAAAAVNLGQAGATQELWERTGPALRASLAEFSGDPLRTMHFTGTDSSRSSSETGGSRYARPETLHPVLRFLLLRELVAADGAHSSTWDDVEEALLHRARRRFMDNEAADEEWAIAYHQLAAGDLSSAAAFLDRRFDEVGAQEWCTELCRLRRAPVRSPGGALNDTPREHFEQLVHAVLDDGRHRDERMKTIIRLLAASWIAPEPRDDPLTDRVGDPYRNPLGDPYAELYPDIGADFLTLRNLVEDERDRHVYLRKSEQYKRRPWW